MKARGALTAGLAEGLVAGDPGKLTVITGEIVTIGEIGDQEGLTGEECSPELPATCVISERLREIMAGYWLRVWRGGVAD